jgi:hypothetical protein
MRSAIYGVIFTAFLASAGIVQAGELDGKALFCTSRVGQTKPCLPGDCPYTVYGLEFYDGWVLRWEVRGYSKVTVSKHSYLLDGTSEVYWDQPQRKVLNRGTLLMNNDDECLLSSKTEIFQKLDEIIATAKKKNKI